MTIYFQGLYFGTGNSTVYSIHRLVCETSVDMALVLIPNPNVVQTPTQNNTLDP